MTELLLYVLQDIIDDPLFQNSISNIESEPNPFFNQFISSVDSLPLPSRPVTVGKQHTTRPLTSSQVLSLQNPGQFAPPAIAARPPTSRKPPVKNEDLLFSAEFQKLTEDLIDATLANILSEADAGDFNITARARLVGLPPQIK